VQPSDIIRWRGHLKTALASTIARVHGGGMPRSRTRRGASPLVLGYHRVVESFEEASRTDMPSMLVSARMLEDHLDCIGRRFTFVGLDEIGAHVVSGEPFEKPVAAVTFDDGYRDVYEQAFAILQRKGIPAAVFVVTELVGKPFWQVHDKLYHLVAKAFSVWNDPQRELEALFGALNLPAESVSRNGLTQSPLRAVSAMLPEMSLANVRRLMDGLEASVGNGFRSIPLTLSWPELSRMHAAGVTIGSHTRNHVSLPMESPEDVADELTGSKRQLEEHLGCSIDHFAYPGGQFTREVVEAVAGAGYRFAYTACCHGDRRHPALTIDRLLLWEGSSVDGHGRFSPAVLTCQAQNLWPPARRCSRAHNGTTRHG
jgi:peptidoglycan/xylan/chitin deacetylase (PgdA/CDA1 family)